MERLTYTVSEVAELLGLSRSKTYELVAAGAIPVVAIPVGASSSPEPPCNALSSSRSAPTAHPQTRITNFTTMTLRASTTRQGHRGDHS